MIWFAHPSGEVWGGGRTRFFGGKSMQQFNLDPDELDEPEEGLGQLPGILELRDEFSRRLTSRERPRLEAFLSRVGSELRAELLERLLPLELAQNQRDGLKVSKEEYLARFPEQADIVQEAFQPKSTELGGETVVASPDSSGRGARRKKTIPHPTKADFPQEKFDNFTLVGKGRQGAVYSAWDERLRDRRAIKIPFAKANETNKQLEQQLIREFTLLRRLRAKGARVPLAYSLGQMCDGTPYLELEYLHYGSLETLLDERSQTMRRPWQQWVAMMIDLAETLAVIHAEQIYHFDIKPDNILVDGSGRLVLCDFAASANHEEFHGGCSIGVTKGYTAPELQTAQDNPAAIREGDGRSDIYSLGVVFYEMFSDIRLPEEVKKDVAKPLPDYFRRLSRGVAATVSTGVEILAKLIDTPRQLSALIPPRPQAEPVEDDSQNPPSQPLRQLVPELPKSIADLIDKMRAELGQRIDSATEVAQRLKAALRRDANPPMKRVKTVAMWGGWVASALVSFWFGTQFFRVLWNLRVNPRPRVVVHQPGKPPQLVVIPGDEGALNPQLHMGTDSPILVEFDQVGDRNISEISFTVGQPSLGGFGFFHDLRLNPLDGIVAEFELVYFELPPVSANLDACGLNTLRMSVKFERYKIFKDGAVRVVEGANVFNGRLCFSLAKNKHTVTIKFDDGGQLMSVGVDDSWAWPPPPCEAPGCEVPIRSRKPLQGSFGLFLNSGDLVLSNPTVLMRAQ